MKVIVGNVIKIENPTKELKDWCVDNLVVDNPEYLSKQRMGLYHYNTPKKLFLYEERGGVLILPYGVGTKIFSFIKDAEIIQDFSPEQKNEMKGEIQLYDYQEQAVNNLTKGRNGILIAPCGSGKTQMGIALIKKLGLKALWVTHTLDLLTQSYDRAKEYYKGDFGTITGGKVNIGKDITFATVQSLSNMDLSTLKDEFNIVVVDECHRVIGSPTKVMQFYKVINSLSARHKYGLSATFTLKGKNDISKTTILTLGEILHTVKDEEVEDKVMKSLKIKVDLDTKASREYLSYDGTMIFNSLLDYLINDEQRNQKIVDDLKNNKEHFNLILTHRVSHAHKLRQMLGEGFVIVGNVDKKIRKEILDKMRAGGIRYLFSTYSLAKEGLDIPILDRLFLATPHKEKSIVKQAVGRIERAIDGKDTPIVYDYVDINIPHLMNFYKKRRRNYQ
jgi:superfamily II DNA or RNA helicase